MVVPGWSVQETRRRHYEVTEATEVTRDENKTFFYILFIVSSPGAVAFRISVFPSLPPPHQQQLPAAVTDRRSSSTLS